MLNFITWDVSPEIISWPVSIRWYGLMFAIGFWIAYNLVSKMYKREGVPESWLGSALMWCALGTIVGARLGHVFFYQWEYYSQHPIEILKTWEGGLASHGGAVGVIIGILLYSWITTKRSPLWTFDRIVVVIAMVGGLIRLGNLMNSEIYGGATDLPWGFQFVRDPMWWHNFAPAACHPTQIYEALCYFALFALLMWMYWKRNEGERPGLIFGTFLIGTFLSRFFIEFIKNDQVAFEAGMTLNMGQLLSIPFVLAGIFLVVRALLRPRVQIDYPNEFAPEPQKNKKK